MDNKTKNEYYAEKYTMLVFRGRRRGYEWEHKELAKLFGYADTSIISRWLRGQRFFDDEKLAKIAQYILEKNTLLDGAEENEEK